MITVAAAHDNYLTYLKSVHSASYPHSPPPITPLSRPPLNLLRQYMQITSSQTHRLIDLSDF